ncbi:hypothetical protein BIFDEN_02045 [Bifidobacterium dentium ATCC 27678]|nr:hypothetical protein BIFDEN_02045 [Bifidobacterium dentium ATCC 27678]
MRNLAYLMMIFKRNVSRRCRRVAFVMNSPPRCMFNRHHEPRMS